MPPNISFDQQTGPRQVINRTKLMEGKIEKRSTRSSVERISAALRSLNEVNYYLDRNDEEQIPNVEESSDDETISKVEETSVSFTCLGFNRNESEILPVKLKSQVMQKSRSLFFLGAPRVSPLPSEPTLSMEEPARAVSFGVDVGRQIRHQAEAPVFDRDLREIMEPHLKVARIKRENSRTAIDFDIDASIASAVGVPYTSLRVERPFLYDDHTHPIHRTLADALGVDGLSLLHKHEIQDKRLLLAPLLDKSRRLPFHESYDNFVTSFCIPLLHSIAMQNNNFQTTSSNASSKIVYRYQAFPCINVVRPGERASSPHCDTADGHSIGFLNFHVPLTPTHGTNALYTESHPGREDWHPLRSSARGLGYMFDGARCLHFTLENMTDQTRVSLDFRIAIYREDDSNSRGDVNGGLCCRDMVEDQYSRAGPGYYDEALIDIGEGPYAIPGSNVARKGGRGADRLFDPDERVGFPFNM